VDPKSNINPFYHPSQKEEMTMTLKYHIVVAFLFGAWAIGTIHAATSPRHSSVDYQYISTVHEGNKLPAKKSLTLDTISPNLRKMEYAVRGDVVVLADQIAQELLNQNTEHKYPFDHIVYTNIGNPQSLQQPPLSWPRQVLALTDLPDAAGIDHPNVEMLFPADVIRRAREIKRAIGSTGSYSHSQGVPALRADVAQFIERRDGYPCHPDNLFLTNGASAAIGMILQALLADSTCGVLIPIPQYPIYSATVDLHNGHRVGYYLDENQGWALNLAELDRAYNEAVAAGIRVNSLVVINPGVFHFCYYILYQ
jgi:alanine transaminase